MVLHKSDSEKFNVLMLNTVSYCNSDIEISFINFASCSFFLMFTKNNFNSENVESNK